MRALSVVSSSLVVERLFRLYLARARVMRSAMGGSSEAVDELLHRRHVDGGEGAGDEVVRRLPLPRLQAELGGDLRVVGPVDLRVHDALDPFQLVAAGAGQADCLAQLGAEPLAWVHGK